jgi:hypothetical protein
MTFAVASQLRGAKEQCGMGGRGVTPLAYPAAFSKSSDAELMQ